MRKAQKEQAEELLRQIEETHDQIKKLMGQGGIQPVRGLLEDCQKHAITIGTLIEKTEGEGHPTVALLEEYCELTYQIHEKLTDSRKEVNENKIYKLLRQKLIKITNSFKNDIHIRKELVFLPYKASMWDSLESVWRAADADPDCDAYIIPIPYYDKKPDGSFSELHDESDQYPGDIPVTRYDTYDFEQRRPDMIFIHNPYDDCNLVTSVPPFFFSANLKKFTEQLIYIPYFVLSEMRLDEEERIEKMKHFCMLPGVYNADKVIVQSEDMRQIYIKVLLETSGDKSGQARKYWEAKILGIGSPKFDKIADTRKEEIPIPDNWRKVIQKPDGSWKKIIFYNTSIAALLQYHEKMLEKIQYVFHIFKENQDEVALLWRPHPLMNTTIESMLPQLWIEYNKIVTNYKEEGWGIYDDTADVDRAIEISDAYYGDASSVVQLYQRTGKPVLMQNPLVLEPEQDSHDIAAAEAICMWQGNYYFTYMEYPLLCKMNKDTFQCELLYQFEEPYSRLYRKVIPYQNKLFLIPFLSDNIAVFDLTTQKMQFFALNEDYVDIRWEGQHFSSKFEDALVYNEILYMIPHSYHAIVKMNMETLEKIEIPLGSKGKKLFCYCLGSGCMTNNKIFFPVHSEGSICVLHMDTDNVVRMYPGESKKQYSNIFAVENKLWMIPEKAYEGIDIWDIDSGFIEKTIMFPGEIHTLSQENKTTDFRLGFIAGRSLNLVAWGLNCNVSIHLDTERIEIWNMPVQYKKEELPLYRYHLRNSGVLLQDEKAIICGLCGEWTICDGSDIHVIERQSIWSRALAKALTAREAAYNAPWEEMTFYQFLELKVQKQAVKEMYDNGKGIYECISR